MNGWFAHLALKNSQLKDAIFKLVKEGYDHLVLNRKDVKVPLIPNVEWEIIESDGSSPIFPKTVVKGNKPYIEHLHNLGDELKQISEFSICVEKLLQATLPQKVKKQTISSLLESFVLSVFHRGISSFDRLYPLFEEDILNEGLESVYITPFYGFESPVEIIDLGKVKIRRLKNEDNYLIETVLGFPSFLGDRLTAMVENQLPPFVIEAHKLMSKDSFPFSGDDSQVLNLIDSVVLALRLFKIGEVGRYKVGFRVGRGWVAAYGFYAKLLRKPYFGKYILRREDIERFRSFWDIFKNLQDKGIFEEKHLKVPLTRFEESYDRVSPKDRLLDYIIILEALLSESSADLRYKVPMRVALLFSPKEQQNADRRFIRKAYDARSSIVHKGDTDFTEVDTVQNWVQKTLRAVAIVTEKLKEKTGASADGNFKNLLVKFIDSLAFDEQSRREAQEWVTSF